MNSYIDRKQIMEEFLKNIYRLSDEKYQERIWVREEGPECNEIDDAVCDFFDDGNPILENYKDFSITERQYELLMKLHSELSDFTDETGLYSPEKSTGQLIQLPQWKEIISLAEEVVKAFNFRSQ